MQMKQTLIKNVVIDFCNVFDEYMQEITYSRQTCNMLKSVGLSLYVYSVKLLEINKEITFQIWNVSPEEKMINFSAVYMKGSMSLFIIFDPSEDNAPRKIRSLLNRYFIFSKKDPILITLVSKVNKILPNHEQILEDYKSLIEDNYQICTLTHIKLEKSADLEQIFNKSAIEIWKIMKTRLEEVEDWRKFKVTEAVNALLEYFPSIKHRIRMKENGIVVQGKLHHYFIDFYGTTYIIDSINRITFICLEDRYNNIYTRYHKTLEFFEENVLRESIKLNPQHIEIISKIVYLLNDSYFYLKDPVFKSQI